jgi:hypothetical protein
MFVKQGAATYKETIRLLIFHGHIQADATRARWIRSMKNKKIKLVDYTRGLEDKEKKFVQLYSGNPTFAARAAGYQGNYITVKKIGRENLRNSNIQAAFKKKRNLKIKQSGFMVLSGGGQGDGIPFKISPKD